MENIVIKIIGRYKVRTEEFSRLEEEFGKENILVTTLFAKS